MFKRRSKFSKKKSNYKIYSDGQISMKKLPWPRKRGHRKPSGGCDDAILNDPISFHQNNNELWMLNFNVSKISFTYMIFFLYFFDMFLVHFKPKDCVTMFTSSQKIVSP